jgi:WD40-like Beta Propeller Repeat
MKPPGRILVFGRGLVGAVGVTLAATTVLAVAGPALAGAGPGAITLASTSINGTKGNDASNLPSVSTDGTRVAFSSLARNLVPGDADMYEDVYVKDLTTGHITLASTSDTGVKGNALSYWAVVSGDGTKVAFCSYATNLDPADTSPNVSLFVKDLVTGNLTLASSSDMGVDANGSSSCQPSMSEVGSLVAFDSDATNLDPADTDPADDIYVKDIETGDVSLASTSSTGVKGNNGSAWPEITPDAAKVAFYTFASNFDPRDRDAVSDVYVKDLVTGTLTLASTSDGGVKGNGDSSYGYRPSISADGSTVAFASVATNLDPGDTDAVGDVYVKDLSTGTITLASTSDLGIKGNGVSQYPVLSQDGAMVAFESRSSNLDPADSDVLVDIYAKDVSTGDVTLTSTNDRGRKGNHGSRSPDIAGDGSTVAFSSAATNLERIDRDSVPDIYVKEIG